MQIVAYANMASAAQKLDISIDFSTLTEPIIGSATMLNVILIVSGVALALLLVFIYIIPLRIAVDSENPLRWYYPCVCGCRRRRAVRTTQEQPEVRTESQDPLLIRPLGASSFGASSSSAGMRASNASSLPARNSYVSSQSFLLSDEELAYIERGMMEPLSGAESHTRLVISNLEKKFRKKTAVDNLSLTLFKNEIFVLLGHNGAGKSTTINMLTGLLKPSAGTAKAIGVH